MVTAESMPPETSTTALRGDSCDMRCIHPSQAGHRPKNATGKMAGAWEAIVGRGDGPEEHFVSQACIAHRVRSYTGALVAGFVVPQELVQLQLEAYVELVLDDPLGQFARLDRAMHRGEQHHATLDQAMLGHHAARPF